jgi:hypothetical protein
MGKLSWDAPTIFRFKLLLDCNSSKLRALCIPWFFLFHSQPGSFPNGGLLATQTWGGVRPKRKVLKCVGVILVLLFSGGPIFFVFSILF